VYIGKKDWLFIAIIIVVLGIFWAISGEEKTRKVPYDNPHRPSYEIVKKSGSKLEADKRCPACHNEREGVRFPANHPVKPKDGPMRCLFCHKLIDTYR